MRKAGRKKKTACGKTGGLQGERKASTVERAEGLRRREAGSAGSIVLRAQGDGHTVAENEVVDIGGADLVPVDQYAHLVNVADGDFFAEEVAQGHTILHAVGHGRRGAQIAEGDFDRHGVSFAGHVSAFDCFATDRSVDSHAYTRKSVFFWG